LNWIINSQFRHSLCTKWATLISRSLLLQLFLTNILEFQPEYKINIYAQFFLASQSASFFSIVYHYRRCQKIYWLSKEASFWSYAHTLLLTVTYRKMSQDAAGLTSAAITVEFYWSMVIYDQRITGCTLRVSRANSVEQAAAKINSSPLSDHLTLILPINTAFKAI